MTAPAENQQTVEAALDTLDAMIPGGDGGDITAVRAALRDLVAQAEQAAGWELLSRDMADELRAWENHNRKVLGGKFGDGQTRDEVESLTTGRLLDRLARLDGVAADTTEGTDG